MGDEEDLEVFRDRLNTRFLTYRFFTSDFEKSYYFSHDRAAQLLNTTGFVTFPLFHVGNEDGFVELDSFYLSRFYDLAFFGKKIEMMRPGLGEVLEDIFGEWASEHIFRDCWNSVDCLKRRHYCCPLSPICCFWFGFSILLFLIDFTSG